MMKHIPPYLVHRGRITMQLSSVTKLPIGCQTTNWQCPTENPREEKRKDIQGPNGCHGGNTCHSLCQESMHGSSTLMPIKPKKNDQPFPMKGGIACLCRNQPFPNNGRYHCVELVVSTGIFGSWRATSVSLIWYFRSVSVSMFPVFTIPLPAIGRRILSSVGLR